MVSLDYIVLSCLRGGQEKWSHVLSRGPAKAADTGYLSTVSLLVIAKDLNQQRSPQSYVVAHHHRIVAYS